LNVQLLERSNSGISLTPAGLRFLEEARNLILSCDDMTKRFYKSIAEPTTDLRIGLTTVVESETFPLILPFLQSEIPNLKVNFKRQISVKSVRDIHQHRLDAAIIGMPTKADGLTVQPLYRDQFCLALPKLHQLRKRKTISLKELNEEILFWFKREMNPVFYDYCESVFKNADFAPQRTPEPTDHHVLLSMIANGAGIGLIPCSLQKIRHNGVIYKQLDEGCRPFIDVSIAYIDPPRCPQLSLFVEKLVKFFHEKTHDKGKPFEMLG
jgi:DNA-binding transcriptional LysR family regulator